MLLDATGHHCVEILPDGEAVLLRLLAYLSDNTTKCSITTITELSASEIGGELSRNEI